MHVIAFDPPPQQHKIKESRDEGQSDPDLLPQ